MKDKILPTKEERANMTKDEMLRSLWLLDEYVDTFGWHLVSEDGVPEPNEHGFWCKLSNGEYRVLFYQDGFYTRHGSMKIYLPENIKVIAWQRLTELAI